MTRKDFRLPDLGEGLTDAEIVRWLVAVGDAVEVDQAVAEVVTAKANVELPCPYAGTVTALHYGEGDVVDVGSVLLSLDAESSSDDGDGGSSSGNVLVGYGTAPERRRRRPRPRPRPAVMSPVVRRLARDLGVDLASVSGTGPDGVIVRADVERQAAADDSPPAPRTTTIERIEIRGLHRQMAERVSRSRREIPEATVWVDVDAGALVGAREAIETANPNRHAGVGVTSLLARICVLGLERFPVLNGRVEGDEIVVSSEVNLGFAAQTDRGLLVPVVRHAEQLTLLDLDDEIRRLSAAARAGTLTTAEVTGGTFTVNNYGVFGVDGSAAVINHPEVAIVGIGRILDRPWVVNGAVQVRPVTELTLAFDHRVCDGGTAGGFLRFVADGVEQPVRLLGRA